MASSGTASDIAEYHVGTKRIERNIRIKRRTQTDSCLVVNMQARAACEIWQAPCMD
jgi:hypothetical protein